MHACRKVSTYIHASIKTQSISPGRLYIHTFICTCIHAYVHNLSSPQHADYNTFTHTHTYTHTHTAGQVTVTVTMKTWAALLSNLTSLLYDNYKTCTLTHMHIVLHTHTHTHTHIYTHTAGQDLGDSTLNLTSLLHDDFNASAHSGSTGSHASSSHTHPTSSSSSSSSAASAAASPYTLLQLASMSDSHAWARCKGCDHFTITSRCGVKSQFRWPTAWGGGQLNFWGTMQHFFSREHWGKTQWYAIEKIRGIPKKAPIRSAFPVYTAIPYPGTIHAAHAEHLSRLLHFVNTSNRLYELMLAVGYKDQRKHVIEECERTPGCVLRSCNKPLNKCNTTALIRAYSSARFCLQLRGDTQTRQGIFDCIALGCIPVLTDAGVLPEFHVHLPRPHEWSLTVGWRTPVNDTLNIIRSTTPERYAAMKAALMRVIPGMLWSHHRYTEGDAYGRLLQHVHAVAQAGLNQSK